MNDFGFEYVTVENIKYTNPFYIIQKEINNCNAIICLAFVKRCYGFLKKHYHTSPWIDIELSLALQKNLRYYIFCDNRIKNTCIISKEYKIPKINYITDWDTIIHDESKELKTFLEWIKSI